MFSTIKFFSATVLFCMLFLNGCSLDQLSIHQIGHYNGKFPCADCPGIVVDLDLNEKATYKLRMMYMERNKTTEETGIWRFIKEKDVLGKKQTILELSPSDATQKTQYILVNNTTLQLLDSYKMQIEAATLKKLVN